MTTIRQLKGSGLPGRREASGRALGLRYDSTSGIITVSPLRPAAPILTAASDTGLSNSDDITSDATPIFTGSAPEGTTVLLFADGAQVSSGTILR